jgi:shikimate 5-dehydrogenase
MAAHDFPIQRRDAPTMYFIGVTTGRSSVNALFPRWAATLGLGEAQLVGVDIPLSAPEEDYRRAVAQIKYDPLSRGGLVTSHKIDLLAAAGDLFDELDELAALGREVSCIAKRGDRLVGMAVDPLTGGRALEAIVGAGYWRERRADVLCLGAGGAGVALATALASLSAPDDRPRRLIMVDVSAERLANLREIVGQLPDPGMEIEFRLHTSAEENDRVMADLAPGSIVINATGLGKDRPGSPITDGAVFPVDGFAWELNYRGEREFLQQARRQAAGRQTPGRGLQVHDGWEYFLLGWTTIIGLVFEKAITPEVFARLAADAAPLRPGES